MVTCSICGQMPGKHKVADGWVCVNCAKRAGYGWGVSYKRKSVADVKADIAAADAKAAAEEEHRARLAAFRATKKIGAYLHIDQEKRQWMIPGRRKDVKVYSFDDVVEYELIQDGDSVASGGLGRAIAGGLLFGGIGAIVGGVTGKRKTKSVINSLMVRITVNDIADPAVFVTFIGTPTKTSSILYKGAAQAAQEVLSALALIVKQNEQNAFTPPPQEQDASSSIFCSQCGNKMPGGSAFCSRCGSKLV